ncbi:hypothetical protein MMC14_008589 [Varicellaria rhodocarpa]|nr:hypothetical protein [Varicellaria rhodocarpa]
METTWKYSATDCFAEPGLCLEAQCCPCITYGKMIALEDDPNLDSYNCCNCNCITFTLLLHFYLAPFLTLAQRGQIRKRYHIKGDGCSDCMCACCWGSCVMVQEVREIRARNDAIRDAAGPNAGGYQLQPQGMTYGQSQREQVPGQENGTMHANQYVDQIDVDRNVETTGGPATVGKQMV